MSELTIEGGIEQPVKSVMLLKRDIDYLLRVGLGEDKANEHTPENWVTIPIFGDGTYDMGNTEAREELRGILGDAFTIFFTGGERDLTNEDIEDYLYKFTIVWTDDDGNIDRDAVFEKEDRDFIVNHFKNFPATELVSLVCHKDEEDGERIYGMFIWLPGKLNRLEGVFHDSDESVAQEGKEADSKT